MKNIVNVKDFTPPVINKKEILRYAGVRKDTKDFDELLESAIKEAENRLTYKVCWCEIDKKDIKEGLNFNFLNLENFKDCSSLIVFCATIGIEIDRLIAKYKSISPSRALIFQALGAERIESLCNEFNLQIKKEKDALKKGVLPRISPGYGGFKIECQKEIFALLDPSKKIGTSLNESLLMSPSKSVSAVIGVVDKKCKDNSDTPCKNCDMKTCEFRRKYENT